MSEEVERYDPDYQGEFMAAIDNGEYVTYSDYEKLLDAAIKLFRGVFPGMTYDQFKTMILEQIKLGKM